MLVQKQKILIYIVIIVFTTLVYISIHPLYSVNTFSIKEIKDIKDINEIKDIKDIKEIKDIKDIKEIKDIKDLTKDERNISNYSNSQLSMRVIPQPSRVFKTKLWDYSIKCDFSGFEGVCNPKSYIMPNNEVIAYISSLMYLSDGGLYWKDNYFNETGLFSGEFIFDKNQFNNKDDYWINPDYYFMNGMKGDCEDISVAIASILENKGVRTKVVGGWITQNNIRSGDWIVEYKIGSVYYRYYGGVFNLVFIPRGIFELRKQEYGMNFEPVLMFDKNSYYEPYNSNW